MLRMQPICTNFQSWLYSLIQTFWIFGFFWILSVFLWLPNSTILFVFPEISLNPIFLLYFPCLYCFYSSIDLIVHVVTCDFKLFCKYRTQFFTDLEFLSKPSYPEANCNCSPLTALSTLIPTQLLHLVRIFYSLMLLLHLHIKLS